jgi:hypothetical protein
MKSKRRHELQTNELADHLGHWIEDFRPYVTRVLVVVVGGVAILAAWFFLASSKERKQALAWRSYMLAGSNPQGDIVAELTLVADDFRSTLAGLWAAQTAADIESARGSRLLFTDRASAETSLNLAKNRYQEVLDSSLTAKAPMLRVRAHFGLAQTFEAQGELEEAKKHFQAVVDSDAASAVGKAAQERLARLELASTARWYNWFERQKPLPRDLGTGFGSGAPGLDALPPLDPGTLPDPPANPATGSESQPPAEDPSGDGAAVPPENEAIDPPPSAEGGEPSGTGTDEPPPEQ